MLRFAHEQSFSVDSGGGGPQSNMYYVPYIFQIGLYLLITYAIALSQVIPYNYNYHVFVEIPVVIKMRKKVCRTSLLLHLTNGFLFHTR